MMIFRKALADANKLAVGPGIAATGVAHQFYRPALITRDALSLFCEIAA
jgi:hypothetical protein